MKLFPSPVKLYCHEFAHNYISSLTLLSLPSTLSLPPFIHASLNVSPTRYHAGRCLTSHPFSLTLRSPIGGRFLFANHDGVAVELSVLPSTRVVDVKRRLREVWPPALLNAVRKNSSGSNIPSNTRTPNSILSRHHHNYNCDDHEEGWSGSDVEDGADEDEGEEDDDGTVASYSGAGPPSRRLRAPDVDRLRLICMGQGLLKDSRTLQGGYFGGFERWRRKEGGGVSGSGHPYR